jgi:hypothetical protein
LYIDFYEEVGGAGRELVDYIVAWTKKGMEWKGEDGREKMEGRRWHGEKMDSGKIKLDGL